MSQFKRCIKGLKCQTRKSFKMRHVWLTLAFVAVSATAHCLEEEGIENNLESIDDKAAPWWEQQDEAAKRRCQSSCTMHSKGVKNPQITLCDDTDVCPVNRQAIDVYASAQCQAWSVILNGAVTGEGRQVKHQPVKGNWLACAVFCKTQSGAWYSPKNELQNLNVDPYFPDGVWCHIDRNTNTNYYCQGHLCLPENSATP